MREPDELPGIRFRLATDAVERVRFVYSAAYEAALSLHVLAEPKRHAAQHAWVRRARRLTPSLRRRLQDFRFAWLFGPPDFLLPRRSRPTSTPSSSGCARSRPSWSRSSSCARSGITPASATRRCSGTRPCASTSLAESGPTAATATSRCSSSTTLPSSASASWRLLSDYRDELFGAEWAALERELAGAVEEAEEQLAADGLYPLLSTFGRRLVVDRERGEFGIDLPHFHRVPVTDESPLHLVPSAFVWPGVRVNCDAPFPLTIVYPAPFVARRARPAAPDPELLRLVRALGGRHAPPRPAPDRPGAALDAGARRADLDLRRRPVQAPARAERSRSRRDPPRGLLRALQPRRRRARTAAARAARVPRAVAQARAGRPASRAFSRRIAFVCSCETRDSVTPSTSPISRRVSSS